jgi:hypothetical protein
MAPPRIELHIRCALRVGGQGTAHPVHSVVMHLALGDPALFDTPPVITKVGDKSSITVDTTLTGEWTGKPEDFRGWHPCANLAVHGVSRDVNHAGEVCDVPAGHANFLICDIIHAPVIPAHLHGPTTATNITDLPAVPTLKNAMVVERFGNAIYDKAATVAVERVHIDELRVLNAAELEALRVDPNAQAVELGAQAGIPQFSFHTKYWLGLTECATHTMTRVLRPVTMQLMPMRQPFFNMGPAWVYGEALPQEKTPASTWLTLLGIALDRHNRSPEAGELRDGKWVHENRTKAWLQENLEAGTPEALSVAVRMLGAIPEGFDYLTDYEYNNTGERIMQERFKQARLFGADDCEGLANSVIQAVRELCWAPAADVADEPLLVATQSVLRKFVWLRTIMSATSQSAQGGMTFGGHSNVIAVPITRFVRMLSDKGEYEPAAGDDQVPQSWEGISVHVEGTGRIFPLCRPSSEAQQKQIAAFMMERNKFEKGDPTYWNTMTKHTMYLPISYDASVSDSYYFYQTLTQGFVCDPRFPRMRTFAFADSTGKLWGRPYAAMARPDPGTKITSNMKVTPEMAHAAKWASGLVYRVARALRPKAAVDAHNPFMKRAQTLVRGDISSASMHFCYTIPLDFFTAEGVDRISKAIGGDKSLSVGLKWVSVDANREAIDLIIGKN